MCITNLWYYREKEREREEDREKREINVHFLTYDVLSWRWWEPSVCQTLWNWRLAPTLWASWLKKTNKISYFCIDIFRLIIVSVDISCLQKMAIYLGLLLYQLIFPVYRKWREMLNVMSISHRLTSLITEPSLILPLKSTFSL